MLGDGGEDTGGQSHVENSVALLAVLFDFVDMFVQLLKRCILIILTGDVRANSGKLVQLFLHLFRRGLDVRLDSSEEFGVVHLGSSIANDFDVLGEELVAELL